MTRPDPALEEAAALRRQAKALEAEATRRRKEVEARERAEGEAARELAELAERVLHTPLAGVLAEVRAALPKSATWSSRVVGAIQQYEREAQPLLARAGVAKGGPFRPDRLLQGHPATLLLPWLALLARSEPDSQDPS